MKKVTRIRLIEERKRRQWSQQEVADFIGTTQRNVSRWELGLTTPGSYFRAKLCELFGMSAQDLGLLDEQPCEEQQHTSILPTPNTSLPDRGQHSSLWYVPYPRNPFFTGREETLQYLHETLNQKRSLILSQSLAISGLGGIGKTQIALEYAYRYRQEYRFIFWASAATQEALLADCMAIADCLQLPERQEQDQQEVLKAAKQWLATHREWLLILDNADELAIVSDFVPTESQGHLLLTSRAQALGSLAQRIEVEKMGMVEATLFLLHRAKLLAPDAFLDQAATEDLAAAEAIAIEMDFLPLALDQAGAYIEEIGCGLSTYLELYRTHRREMLQRRGHVPTTYPESVATTWSLSFQKIERANPAAAELLRLYAFLEPDTIPEELLSEASAHHLGPVLCEVATDAFRLNEAIEELRKFSLVQRQSETRTLRIHRLVQTVQRDSLEPEQQRQWADRVIRTINMVFPPDPEEMVDRWAQCLRYLAQVQACETLVQQQKLLLPEAADLFERTGLYLLRQASHALAELLYQHALSIREQLWGSEHPVVARSLYKLADLYSEQGKYEQAEPLFLQARSIWEKTPGPHPEMASLLHQLAIICCRQGKYEQAEPLFLQARSIWEKTLGPEHSNMALTLNGLALLYRLQGKYEQVEPLFLQAIAITEHYWGPGHPEVARPLNNLAEFYRAQKKYKQAEPLFLQSRSIWEKTLGPEHPNVAYTLNDLAHLYLEQGMCEQAEPLFQQSLCILERVYGQDHPEIANTLQGLAQLYGQWGMEQQAETLFQRALRIQESMLGKQSPRIADTLHAFASFREAQNHLHEAVSLLQRALAISEQSLGLAHQKTAETRRRYLALLRVVGREEEAMHIEMLPAEQQQRL